MDLGAGRRGVDMGPSAIRIAGLNQAIAFVGYEVTDAGNVHVHPPEAVEEMNPRARYLSQIAAATEELAAITEAALEDGALPVVLGGDHSIAIGSVSGLASFYRKQGRMDDAMQLLEDYRGSNPTTVAGTVLLSSIYAARGDTDELETFLDRSDRMLARDDRYRCGACGFEAREMRWHCPRCNRFDSFVRKID